MHIMTKTIKMPSPAKLAQRIHAERMIRGLTLTDLGIACGVHHSQLSRIEQGKVIRVSKNLEKVCTFLQISLDGNSPCTDPELMLRVERLILKSTTSARAIESLVTALEELTQA
ncbi:helix-turn-helix domain-containing protein [Ectopseudomonas mendocina]